jgi:hypothetical protein
MLMVGNRTEIPSELENFQFPIENINTGIISNSTRSQSYFKNNETRNEINSTKG